MAETPIDRFSCGDYSDVNRHGLPRYQFQVEIEMEWRSKRVWGRVKNISRKGMFIEVDEAPRLGAKFSGNLSLNVPLRVIGCVRRTVPRYGIGVTFIIPEQTDQRRFEALLIALAQGSDPTTASAEPPHTNADEPLRCHAASAARHCSGA